jgi:hypothetical protein
LERVELKGSGKITSRIGLGCGRLVGGASLRESAAVIEAALAVGITHFDVAPSYGLGLAENVLGEVLAGRYDGVTVATKVGIARPAAPGAMSVARKLLRPIARAAPMLKQTMLAALARNAVPRRFGVEQVEASFSESLRRLRHERVDLLLLHEPQREDVTASLAELCEQFVRDGRSALYGTGTGAAPSFIVPFGTVRQYRWTPSDIRPVAPGEMHIRHGVMRYGLAALAKALTGKPARVRDFSERLGFDMSDRSIHAALLLTGALAADDDSIVLVSSNDVSRLKTCVVGVDWSVIRNGRGRFSAAFDELLEDEGSTRG